MSVETKKKLFTEYYTTKENSEGHGLGLILCKNIIENHSGKIEVDSELGKGTTFKISLPIKKAN
jgi:signal transduction histidine kinase